MEQLKKAGIHVSEVKMKCVWLKRDWNMKEQRGYLKKIKIPVCNLLPNTRMKINKEDFLSTKISFVASRGFATTTQVSLIGTLTISWGSGKQKEETRRTTGTLDGNQQISYINKIVCENQHSTRKGERAWKLSRLGRRRVTLIVRRELVGGEENVWRKRNIK